MMMVGWLRGVRVRECGSGCVGDVGFCTEKEETEEV